MAKKSGIDDSLVNEIKKKMEVFKEAFNVNGEEVNGQYYEEEKSMKFIREMQGVDPESERLAKVLQQQEDIAEKELLKKADEDNKAECEICFDKINMNDLIPLDCCGHSYHPKCLYQHFGNMIEERKFPLNCPSCRIEVTATDVRGFLTPELIKKWEDYTFKKLIESNPKDYSYCPTPDCPYVFVWEQERDSNLFECPRCTNKFCLNCKCKFHDNQTCQEYRISKGFTVSNFNKQ
jgi:hypothetical protein